MNRDPIHELGGEHLYNYGSNKVTNSIDPLGRWSLVGPITELARTVLRCVLVNQWPATPESDCGIICSVPGVYGHTSCDPASRTPSVCICDGSMGRDNISEDFGEAARLVRMCVIANEQVHIRDCRQFGIASLGSTNCYSSAASLNCVAGLADQCNTIECLNSLGDYAQHQVRTCERDCGEGLARHECVKAAKAALEAIQQRLKQLK